MAHAAGSPTDWTSGERVFAPPSGTLDPAWLVPAVLERVPAATPQDALAALTSAWRSARARHPGTTTSTTTSTATTSTATTSTTTTSTTTGATAGDTADELARAARDVVAAALDQFAVPPGRG
ncbi:hypothetical protein [Cellulomonas marina]|uniref:Uncharacterized protein n=1 Tax=Cellulomonas marina TaxID=988821 RepID=A0A1I0X809_9CELL|nr:hypothetical protein [Cellulomonas marina]GIG29468.1 hypothetical protein Cma02nite_20680 [Cellulomonas marina]SFA96556.1 hypothetical protein SAMN05421867_104163 [Cellulomonas marina]